MNKPIFHFSTRAYDDELSEGLHLAGYDVSDRETGEVFFISRTYYGNPKKVFDAAQNDLKCKAAGFRLNRVWVDGKDLYIELLG